MRTFVRLAACCVFGTGIGFAGIKTFNNAVDNDWNNDSNWSPSGKPSQADRAVIPSGEECHVTTTSAVADTLNVSGSLVIDAGKVLTLDNDDDNVGGTPDNSAISGSLTLAGADSTLKFVENSHEVSGEGEIIGEHNDAVIEIAANITFTNELDDGNDGIRGGMQFVGLSGTTNGAFSNEGRVGAEDGLTIWIQSSTPLYDVPNAQWLATGCGSTLLLARDSRLLEGNFTLISDATLDCRATIRTCGTFSYSTGRVLVASGSDFSYQYYGGTCTNPGNGKWPVTCEEPWVVTGNNTCTSCP